MIRITASDGASVAVRLEGPESAPALVLLHSIGCDHAMWDAQMPALTGYRTLRIDIRGHGGSNAPAGDYLLSRLAADVVDVLDALNIDKAAVCGLSLGGAIAQQVALDFPGRITRLVLANTAARIGSADAWTQRAGIVREQGLAAIADMAMNRFFADRFRERRPEVVTAFRNGLLQTSAEGYAGCCGALRDADLRGELGRIIAPTLVIAGSLDVSTPSDQMREFAAGIPGATFVELDAAHLSNVEQPEAFSAELVKHLGSL